MVSLWTKVEVKARLMVCPCNFGYIIFVFFTKSVLVRKVVCALPDNVMNDENKEHVNM
jgi:hypothetical protein